ILANSSYRWMLLDLAIQSGGGTTVGIYASNLSDEIAYILNDCGATMILVEDKAQLDKLLAVKHMLPGTKAVGLMSDDAATPADWVTGWAAFERLGKERHKELEPEIERRIAAIDPSEALCLIYTSGTTGMPKGVVLTHQNLLYEAQSTREIGLIRDDDTQL